jgi:hypothetical protein
MFMGDTQYHFPCTASNSACKSASSDFRTANDLNIVRYDYSYLKRDRKCPSNAYIKSTKCYELKNNFFGSQYENSALY